MGCEPWGSGSHLALPPSSTLSSPGQTIITPASRDVTLTGPCTRVSINTQQGLSLIFFYFIIFFVRPSILPQHSLYVYKSSLKSYSFVHPFIFFIHSVNKFNYSQSFIYSFIILFFQSLSHNYFFRSLIHSLIHCFI